MKVWLTLFWGFFKVGILGFGGGPGSIGLVQATAVDGYHWMTNEKFAEMLAVGNALPGPIATKLAAAIGYQVGGPIGTIAALLGAILPSLALMLGFYRLLIIYQSNPYVAGLIRGVKPIVIALLVLIIIGLLPSSFPKGRWAVPAIFFAGGFASMYWLKVPAVWVILASMAGGAWFLR